MGILSAILDLLYPPKCVLCRRVLTSREHGVCKSCGAWAEEERSQIRGTFCARCGVALTYEEKVREAIHRFKFGDQPGYATAFGALMAKTVEKDLAGTYDLISWIPVSQKRFRQRGYDQAKLLAASVALCLQDQAVETLRKKKDNPQQSGISDHKLRKQNVKDVYEVPDAEGIRGKRILLIDDVITTGATMEEAARTLLRAGASSVVGAALARPPEKHTKEEQL